MNILKEKFLWLWQIPQHIVGFVLSLFSIKSEKFYDSTIYYLPWKSRFGVSLGKYIILSTGGFEYDLDYVKAHEYGHSIQSRILGPLYLIIVGIPSASRNIYSRFKFKSAKWYYSGFPEKWANVLYEKHHPGTTKINIY